MKVKFNKLALQEALSLVTSVVPSRTPKPILQCVKLTAEGAGVLVSATDLEVGINCRMSQVEVDKEGTTVLPADKLNSIVRESVDEVIEFEASEASVNIKGADSVFTIYGHDVSQYPIVPGFEGKGDLEVSLPGLQQAIELTVFAAAKESTRYAINGILCEVSGKKLTLVSTDGRRLARAVLPLESAPAKKAADMRIIIPSKAMSLLDKIAGASDANVQVRLVDNNIVLACGDVVITSNLVEGNFPKYEDIIPSDYDRRVHLSTDAMLSAVRRAALLANQDSKGIKLSLGKNLIVLTSRSPETGDAKIDLHVDYDGEAVEIGFNPQFLIDVLRVIKSDEFDLELGESDRPGMIKCGPDFLYIVMPVNI